MSEQLEFSNFKVLPQATLPLGPFNLLVGPNGSGKSTAMFALHAIRASGNFDHKMLCTFGSDPETPVHPRLPREIRDAMYRLAYPEQFGEQRPPTQVIATTHSPYLLDRYRDHPEEIVIAQRAATGAHFERLSDRAELAEVLRETHLGEAWYSGVLGGVPAGE